MHAVVELGASNNSSMPIADFSKIVTISWLQRDVWKQILSLDLSVSGVTTLLLVAIYWSLVDFHGLSHQFLTIYRFVFSNLIDSFFPRISSLKWWVGHLIWLLLCYKLVTVWARCEGQFNPGICKLQADEEKWKNAPRIWCTLGTNLCLGCIYYSSFSFSFHSPRNLSFYLIAIPTMYGQACVDRESHETYIIPRIP